MRGPEDRRLRPRPVALRLVAQPLLAVLAGELAVGVEDHRRVVARLAVRFEEPRDELDVQLVRERREPPEPRPLGDRLAERPVRLQGDRLVGDRVPIEEALRRADDPGSPSRGLPDHGLRPAEVGLLVAADPLEDDRADPDRARGRWGIGRHRGGRRGQDADDETMARSHGGIVYCRQSRHRSASCCVSVTATA